MKKKRIPAQVWTTVGRKRNRLNEPVYKNTYAIHKFNSTDDKRESHLTLPISGPDRG